MVMAAEAWHPRTDVLGVIAVSFLVRVPEQDG